MEIIDRSTRAGDLVQTKSTALYAQKLILNRLKEPANLESEIMMESGSKIPSSTPSLTSNILTAGERRAGICF